MLQWLILCASTARGHGFDPWLGTKILNATWRGQKNFNKNLKNKINVKEENQWEMNLLVWTRASFTFLPAWSNPKNRSCLYSGIRAQKLGRPTWVPCLFTDHSWPLEYLDILTLENWLKRFCFPAHMAQEGLKQPRGYGDFGWLYNLFVKVLPIQEGESLKNNSSPKKEKQTFFFFSTKKES